MTTNHEPFASDLEFTLAWVEFARAKCKRLDIEARRNEAEQDPRPLRGVVGVTERTATKELSRRLKAARDAEVALRTEIDARVERNRHDGPYLAIDRMTEEFGLGDIERTTLLLAVIPCLGHSYGEMFNCLSTYGFSGNSLTVESAWGFMEMNGEARIRSRVIFLPTGPLLAKGLVATTYYTNPTPDNVPGAVISITSQAFSRIVGMPELAAAPGKDGDDMGR